MQGFKKELLDYDEKALTPSESNSTAYHVASLEDGIDEYGYEYDADDMDVDNNGEDPQNPRKELLDYVDSKMGKLSNEEAQSIFGDKEKFNLISKGDQNEVIRKFELAQSLKKNNSSNSHQTANSNNAKENPYPHHKLKMPEIGRAHV